MSKVVTFSDSAIKNMSINVLGDTAEIILVGEVLGYDEPIVRNLFLNWEDLPPQIKNSANNFMKHLSREYSKYWANEDKDTWVDL